MINIDVDEKDSFARIHDMLQDVPGGVEKAMRGVIKRGTEKIRTESFKYVSKYYNISPRYTKRDSRVYIKQMENSDGVCGIIHFSGYRIPLYKFYVSHKTPERYANKFVKANIGGDFKTVPMSKPVKAGLEKNSTKKVIKDAFIAEVKGEYGIYERTGTESYQIRQLTGLSIAHMLSKDEVMEGIESEAWKTIDKRVEHEITRILNDYGR